MEHNVLIQKLEEYVKKVYGIDEVAVIARNDFKSKQIVFDDKTDNQLQSKSTSDKNKNNIYQIKNKTARLSLVEGEEVINAKDEPQVLSDVLKRTVLKFPNRTIHYIADSGQRSIQTYADLLMLSQKILAGIRKYGLKPKDNLVLLFDRSDHFINAFWACILGGVVPVPITIPKDLSSYNNETASFMKIWSILDKTTIFTSRHIGSKLEQLKINFDFDTKSLIYIDDLIDEEPDTNWYHPQSEDTAIILFTSGSTGLPKGVMQTHKSILARERGTTLFNKFTSDEISLNWMTIEHVASIIMFHVKEVYLGCKQIQVRTQYILNEPLRWLDLLSEFQATITWAPNFAFDLINKRIEQGGKGDWDLSSLRVITNAAEAINSNTTKKFLKLLNPYGLSDTSIKPSWGMSETCSCTIYSNNFTSEENSGTKIVDKRTIHGRIKEISQTDNNSTTFVELGTTIPGMDMRIVDDNNNVINEGIVGKLQVRGEVVTKGYYKNEEINKSTFVGDGWFDTGDLAFIRDGRVTLTGRAKEIIIINGIHYSSSEIEKIVNFINGVQVTYSAACSVFDSEKGKEVVLIFFVPLNNDYETIISTIEEIKSELLRRMSIAPDYIIPITAEEFPKTNIGKIQHSQLIKRYNNGNYNHIIKEINDYIKNDKVSYSFMKEVWIEAPLNNPAILPDNRFFLVFLNDITGDKIIDDMSIYTDCHCIKVYKGESFNKINSNIYFISEKDVNCYQKLFESINKDGISIDTIIHLWNYGNENNVENIDKLRAVQYESTYSILYIIKSLKIFQNYSINLILITSNAASVFQDDKIEFEKTAVIGLLKTIREENSRFKLCHIDTKAEDIKNCSNYIVNEIINEMQDNYVCYRDGQRYIQRLSSVEVTDENIVRSPIKNNATYIITGGLGGIGYEISKYLLSSYQVNLIIVGSSDLKEIDQNSEKLEKLQELYDYGDIEYYAANVSDFKSFKYIVDIVEKKYNEKISGIFHLAGMNMDSFWNEIEKHSIENESIKGYESMFEAKVYGSLVINKIFENYENFIYVFFSSVNSYFGGNCVGAYSAANSFIDGIAKSISAKQDCRCFSWSTWHKTGMNKNNAMAVAATQKGFQSIKLQDGIELFDMVMKQKEHNLFIGLIGSNINIYNILNVDEDAEKSYYIFYSSKKEYVSKSDLYKYILNQGIPQNLNLNFVRLMDMPMKDSRNVDYDKLLSLSFESKRHRNKYIEPSTETEKLLYSIWKDVLQFNEIGVNTNFFDCGGNSVNVHVVVARINIQFDIDLPMIEIYKNSQISKLALLIDKYKR